MKIFVMNTYNHFVFLAMFTSSFEQMYCIEGEMLQLTCSVYSESVDVEWFKDDSNPSKNDKIESNEHISLNRYGKDHVLTIKNAKMRDAGLYIIIAGNVRKLLSVTVEGNLLKRETQDYYYPLLASLNVICEQYVLIA